MRAGIAAALPDRLMHRTGFALDVQGSGVSSGSVRVLAVGKAAAGMARAALEHLGSRDVDGLVIVPRSEPVAARLRVIVGNHPVPNEASEVAGRQALQFARSCAVGDTLAVLISGGASALMAVPAEGITLEEKRATTSRLLKAGADIHALNAVRKHLSSIKGGWLAASCPGRTRAYAISDVVGDDLSVIGSGPTVADPSTFGGALTVLDSYGGRALYPAAVVRRLEQGMSGRFPETPKPGDARLARATTVVIGGRHDAMRGAAAEASARGYHVTTIDDAIAGEARVAARTFVERALSVGAPRPSCVVASGETTVHVTGTGRGGRNQEFALAAASALLERGATGVLASVGTDGVDGPTDAAGACVDDTTLARASSAGLAAPEQVLDANDSHPFFAALGDLIHTGPTGTNVGDLQVFLLA